MLKKLLQLKKLHLLLKKLLQLKKLHLLLKHLLKLLLSNCLSILQSDLTANQQKKSRLQCRLFPFQ